MTGMDFKSAAGRVRNLLAGGKPKDLSSSALKPDVLRDNIIRETEQASERFQGVTRREPTLSRPDGAEFPWSSFGEAVRDFARGLFGWDEPDLLGRDKVKPSHRLNREVAEGAFASDWFQQSRPYARNNTLESTMGATAFADQLEQIGQGALEEHVERAERLSDAEQAQQSAEDWFEQLRQQAKQDVQDQGEVQPGTRREIKQALKAIDAAGELVNVIANEQSQAGMTTAGLVAGGQAAQAAADSIEGTANLSMFGLDGGESHNVPLDKQLELAEKWAGNPMLREVARMLGRMVRSMTFKRDTRTKNVQVEPVGITNGDELRSLLPHELARARSTSVLQRMQWAADWAASQLLQYQYEGKTKAGKGAIITVHDGSGSMSGAKFVWATSLCLALYKLAHREHRQFAGAEFGSAGQIKRWIFPARKPVDPEQVLDYATHFFNGGTSILTGLREALAILHEHPEFKTADVVLIGDGICSFGAADQKVCDELRAMGVRIHGISILTPSNSYFAKACDWWTNVTDLAGPNDASDRLAESLT